ncbi:alanine--tRNA ligase [Candidatus Daviesbacteria bacterium]|nr:alanine--tRNA ligase [Candidatus Daviesbacteria bacterium]
MSSKDIREKYIKFFVSRGHKQIPAAKLVPENDPTTLFTSSGMQPLVPYLLGQKHPEGKRLVDCQPSFRAEDIEEVGDNRHTTFFEMLGNWSLGDYFKVEQLPWIWEFFTKELSLDKDKLYVSVFEGNNEVPKDEESLEIWRSLGVDDDHIFFYGVDKNWWSCSGSPNNMPAGEIGGPDSEVFYEFTQIEHDKIYGDKCHPNCECGRFLEIGNSVFIEYQKQQDGSLKELPQKNVDFGGGLERLTAAVSNTHDIFQTVLYKPITDAIAQAIGLKYEGDNTSSMRIIADHLKAATFLILDGVPPSNKLQGYVLRRLIRRSTIKMRQLSGKLIRRKALLISDEFTPIIQAILTIYGKQTNIVEKVIGEEIGRFAKTLDHGLKEIEKIENIDGKKAFDLYQTFGFPYEITEELFRQKGQKVNKEQFKAEFEKHKTLSRTASAGMFKGGLADHGEIVTKFHTATHLLHQALRDVLGPQVFQKGSNITSERLRFDFSFERKITEEEIKQVEDIMNKRITEGLKVDHMTLDLQKAKEMNAIGLFHEKYASKVSIYGVGPNFQLDPQAKDKRERDGYYSLEFCGGPHVDNTSIIGKVKIIKEEAVSSGIRRIRVKRAS